MSTRGLQNRNHHQLIDIQLDLAMKWLQNYLCGIKQQSLVDGF
jgi:hypothetical protein